MANDTGRLTAEIAKLEYHRKDYLEVAREKMVEAARYLNDRDRPQDPTRAMEHRRACEQKVADAHRAAERALREAENMTTRIRGLERELHTR
jgi:hypothetical protein